MTAITNFNTEPPMPLKNCSEKPNSCHGGCPWCEENRKHKFRDKKPMMEANPNVRKKLFLTASQVEMLGGYENARSLADGHEIVLIPEEIQEEDIHERTAGTQETL